MAWTEERKKAASDAAKARIEANKSTEATEGPVEPKEIKAIEEPAQEEETVSEEAPAPSLFDTVSVKPDLSRMDDENKMSSLVNILRQFPPQYLTEENVKDTVWSVARFTPTDEMLTQAREGLVNPRSRFPN